MTEEPVENIVETIAALDSTVEDVVTTFDYTPNWPGFTEGNGKRKVAPQFPIPKITTFTHDGLIVITIEPPIRKLRDE